MTIFTYGTASAPTSTYSVTVTRYDAAGVATTDQVTGTWTSLSARLRSGNSPTADRLVMTSGDDLFVWDDRTTSAPGGGLNGASNYAFRNGSRNRAIETIDAGAGNDVINLTSTSSGQDYWRWDAANGGANVNMQVNGGTGDDIIWGDNPGEKLYGDDGNDWIDGGAGNDSLYGGAGNDSLVGGPGNDLLYGGDGNDILIDLSGNNQIFGGLGDDTVYGGTGNDTIDGGGGNDTIRDVGGTNTIGGGAGDDWIYGGTGNDTIDGGDGGDVISDAGGANVLRGGAGDDYIYGGAGADTAFGDDGNDVISGADGNDRIDGGLGQDVLWGGGGVDTLYGGSDTDYLYGGAGNGDTMYGGAGDDYYYVIRGDGTGDRIVDSGGTNTIILFGGFGSSQWWIPGTGVSDYNGGVIGDMLGGAGSGVSISYAAGNVFTLSILGAGATSVTADADEVQRIVLLNPDSAVPNQTQEVFTWNGSRFVFTGFEG
jgi:Ca2+-binding RTX toxin-like protein